LIFFYFIGCAFYELRFYKLMIISPSAFVWTFFLVQRFGMKEKKAT